MARKIEKNYYKTVSNIEPDFLRRFIITEVEEKAKDKLYNCLKDLVDSYPQFSSWYYNVVIPELELKDGRREIIICISKIENSQDHIITGIAILKKTDSEKKICTFRVHENYRDQGIGTRLFEECFKYLDTRLPVITITQDRVDMFKYHIEKYGFKKEQVLDGYYKPGVKEYVYNGTI
ncbi:ribosomal-protein-alanine acetyltransferase [[Clostridium] sordellii]|uniref:GNAT family N-acetyltransferase n=1 Tax=Paraclostridium sordellii TaxID=1505 RepID=UPI0005DBACF8|nr:GNAT family N-acetyltransferase [Paeniclostridium sordellii]MBX9179655.1 GNAT family N-acetyltransferase [Paeniclostridium sordellii]CEO12031.1 ribosomal-protein-alanine acetyltransferase [[Clostridium] sordellii] [Paeniclostridium sordellii]